MSAKMDKAKGKAKEVEGKLTGDKVRQIQGVAEQIKGNLKGVARKAETAVKNLVDSVTDALTNGGRKVPVPVAVTRTPRGRKTHARVRFD